jgi:tRNA(Ile2) C34 agmatinyltransferase TiaS
MATQLGDKEAWLGDNRVKKLGKPYKTISTAAEIEAMQDRVNPEERGVCEIALRLMADPRPLNGLEEVIAIERARRHTSSFEMIDICDLAMKMIQDRNVARRAGVTKVQPEPVTKVPDVTKPTCRVCGKEMEAAVTGRPQVYCSGACRMKASRAKGKQP